MGGEDGCNVSSISPSSPSCSGSDDDRTGGSYVGPIVNFHLLLLQQETSLQNLPLLLVQEGRRRKERWKAWWYVQYLLLRGFEERC